MITDFPYHLPSNTLGWQHPQNSIRCPQLGSIDSTHPVSWLHLYIPTPSQLRTIKKLCLCHSRHSKDTPWRHVFILPSSSSQIFSRYAARSPTPYRQIGSFTATDDNFTIFMCNNHLSDTVDSLHLSSLESWLRQFDDYVIHYTPPPIPTCRRPIRRFIQNLPRTPNACAQPYLHHLNLPHISKDQPDPSLLLCGVLLSRPMRKKTLHHTHLFLREIYTRACKKYRIISDSLKSTTET